MRRAARRPGHAAIVLKKRNIYPSSLWQKVCSNDKVVCVLLLTGKLGLRPCWWVQVEMGLWDCTDTAAVTALLPKHPRMSLVGFTRQRCVTQSIARVIVVMQKSVG